MSYLYDLYYPYYPSYLYPYYPRYHFSLPRYYPYYYYPYSYEAALRRSRLEADIA